jgi:dUTP pyrophosphatase
MEHGNVISNDSREPRGVRLNTKIKFTFEPGYETVAPSRGTAEAAGFDLSIPLLTDKFQKDFDEKLALIEKEDGVLPELFAPASCNASGITLPPGARAIIPSGIRFNIPHGYMLMGANRGGNSSIKGITFLAHVIDSDYTGVVFMSVWNTSPVTKVLKYGSKLLQLLVVPVPETTLEFTTPEQLYSGKVSARGEGSLGHTDTKGESR